jgi:small subunit ribosomal protein S19
MPRSLKTGPYVDPKLLKKIQKAKAEGKNVIEKTWSRASTIIPEMIGFTIGVHNGKSFTPVLVKDDLVGYKLGEFSYSTSFKKHGGQQAKKATA